MFLVILRLLPVLLLLLNTACVQQPLSSGRPGSPASQPMLAEHRPPVILISIDGFRPDYLQRHVTPQLNALAAQGTRAAFMRPSFPSITFPNHYTLVTGLRPDHHGLVGNTMTDPAIPGVRFTLGNRDAVTDRRWWDQAEPVWVTAEKQGVRTATMFWPGSEADIHGVRPSEWRVFDGKVPPAARVDTVLQWLDQPAGKRPDFLTLYFDDVDHAGHEFGPDAAQTTEAVAVVDQAVGRLVSGLQARRITANLIIVSDHGMAATSEQRMIYLDTILPPDSIHVVTVGAYAGLEPAAGQQAIVNNSLLQAHPHMTCWEKQHIPARYVYGSNARVPAIICLAESGWLILPDHKMKFSANGGTHGYDPDTPDMAALFIANGPAFQAGVVLPAIDNVDVYPLLMQLTGVPALPSDGDIRATAAALRPLPQH
ncbi:alkaline phosphatase family protein [Undibacterium oligocarboniphilum]|uniref:Alkaline phosphatase family protein n=1 Tax=Undibacterium oligocarboniphilum TaxID=666702 RepID=A0A850QKS7_9BURK|nr:ectonucleotide pyrophosphatase/phosphodiesterase [Undibacterium oligocarboniphilum]MBC3869614.1 alkaline phosphatase family protein [Undibacterium oligocarboniphilum]NVO77993.1 alkaline phosphatase family protein [Undibacterium oligocarboniphilum]